MIANGKPAKGSLPQKSDVPAGTEPNILILLKTIVRQIRLLHVFIVVGLLSVLLGYLSVAPPSELPSWPLYSLNARTWQFFERWGQHVKPHHVRVMTMALQHHESRTLYVLAYLEIPDVIKQAGEPLSCEEIKARIDKKLGYDPINLPYLCRILHAAAHFDLLVEVEEEKYSLTPLSEYLTSTHPKSLKGFVKLYSGDEALVVSTALSRSIFSGNSGFLEIYRSELSQQLKADPQLQQIHDAGMADYARLHAPAIIADYPSFGSCKHICDIGGGIGSFLNSILQYYSYNMQGTNFDLPDVIENSKAYVKALEVQDKMALVAGNFTETIPKFDCDCYILKDILEEWSDETAVLILSKLYAAMKKDSRLLVMEKILHTGTHSEERFKSLLDMTMMAFNPSQSRLRTEEELYFLLQHTGFADQQTYATRAGYSIIETFPAGE